MGIIRNAAKCLDCGVTIESEHTRDWRQCECGHVYVDGGKEYVRHGMLDPARYENLSEFTKDTPAGDRERKGDEFTTSKMMEGSA